MYFFRFYWKDSRVSVKEGALKGKKEYLDLVKNEDYEMLWVPDIFIDQAIDIRCCVVYISTSEKKTLISFNLAHQEPPLPHRHRQCEDLWQRDGQLCAEDEL